jgi:hypothetical protein
LPDQVTVANLPKVAGGTLMMAPYLGWLGYAGYLNDGIVRGNLLLA